MEERNCMCEQCVKYKDELEITKIEKQGLQEKLEVIKQAAWNVIISYQQGWVGFKQALGDLKTTIS